MIDITLGENQLSIPRYFFNNSMFFGGFLPMVMVVICVLMVVIEFEIVVIVFIIVVNVVMIVINPVTKSLY